MINTQRRIHVFESGISITGGVSIARKRGLEKACGRYIFWVDADDWCETDLLEIVIKKFQKGHHDVVVWGWNDKEEIARADFKEKPLKEWQDSVLLGKGTTLWLFAAVRTLWAQIKFPHDMNAGGEDGYASLSVFMAAKNIGVYPQVLYHHRNVVENSVPHRISSQKYYDTMRLWREREKIAEERFPQHAETCRTGILTSAVKAYCMNLELKDLKQNEIKDIERQLRQTYIHHIPGRWKEKVLRCVF